MVPYIKIFKKLNKAKIRYLVAGGVAVNLHQINRGTVDLDLIVHLEQKNTLGFVKVMSQLGLVPKVPVDPKEFANEISREKWIKEKGMIVFSFLNPDNPLELVDIFVREPMPFQKLYKGRKNVKAFNIIIPVLGILDLIKLKEAAGRDKDLFDIKILKKMIKE
ncbi:MAG: hypothetical protein A3G32_03395 [Deltaproteobacteria bacterium RIFCSPLOWO2_12_FULL_40_28]|nr:MAG: hypothetical protein A3C45_02080 [Deltaproteobacteria bacterium RIFCSPHIGHO2_02_FULL_40_28]OGQ20140.1 MAG: hypothetical protein A3E27_01375 [Deltaproteobacteria bacterium RIFCSPHIGHO2_12_FULL_40_32]OGQ40711.1 MAG: hypothetical protein A3I69_02640 [Deltaproteobacteria bacterium RIFCSPLOWO2_02_FULL_40_36]OGQ54407.1 MAG: hypothetical protein A3G32_03395 [Deltaproteobacteria bacterium RIFCSPLOWO2_12_FULL_40_28]